MTKSSKRKLYRSKNDKIIAGIFGGLGEYFDIDANLLRVVVLFFIFLTFFGGLVPFIFIYLVAMFIIPSEREKNKEEDEGEDKNKDKNVSPKPIYKKWMFWLIIAIFFLPVILMALGFFFFAARMSGVTDIVEIREERIIIEQLKNDNDYIRIYREE